MIKTNLGILIIYLKNKTGKLILFKNLEEIFNRIKNYFNKNMRKTCQELGLCVVN